MAAYAHGAVRQWTFTVRRTFTGPNVASVILRCEACDAKQDCDVMHAGLDVGFSDGETAIYLQVGNAWFRP